jgi:uncharacterized protein (DUF1330 family)
MAVYVVVDIDVTDPVGYEEYKKLAAPTVAAYGGRYLVRGGAVEVLEGDWVPNRFVILEFESVARAKEWWGCQEYAAAKEVRHRTATTHMIVAEGL